MALPYLSAPCTGGAVFRMAERRAQGGGQLRFSWDEQRIRWFDEASAYTGFHQKLRSLLLMHIGRRESLADLGCGAGLIDFALAGDIDRITCVDESALAVAAVKWRAEARGLTNIKAVQADAYQLRGEWDNVLMVFFGAPALHALHYLSLCREGVLAVVHGDGAPGDGHAPKGNTIQSTRAALDAQGIAYRVATREWEYGQPFRSRAEAARYAAAYHKHANGEAVEAYLNRHLAPAKGEYSWYLPYLKRFGLFALRKNENAALLGAGGGRGG